LSVTSVIVVTIHENPDYLFEVLKAGAAGYVLKDATQEEAHPPKDLERAQSPYNVLLRGLRGEKSRSWDCWLRGKLLGYCVIDVPAMNGSVESTSWLLGL
jgi:hypothetical protein